MGFNTGRRGWFLGASVAASATIGSNVLPALLLVIASGLIVLLFIYKMRHESKNMLFRCFRTAFLWWFLPSVILSLPFSNVYFAYISTAVSSLASPTHLTAMEIAGWANSAWLLEVILWAGIASVAGFFLFLLGRPFFDKHVLLTDVAVALLSATCFGFLLMRDIRFLGFFEICFILILGFIPGMLDSILTYLKARRFMGKLILIFVLSIVLVIGTVGHRRLLIAYDWYHVINTPVLTAFDWLHDNADEGSIVVATGADRGHNYGWWIEGYAHLPTYMAGDRSLFFSPEERTQVELARRILMLDIPPDEIRVLVGQYNIRFLFLDKKYLQKTLIDMHKAGFVERFENDAILIMENKDI